jgi:hypothetical protein
MTYSEKFLKNVKNQRIVSLEKVVETPTHSSLQQLLVARIQERSAVGHIVAVQMSCLDRRERPCVKERHFNYDTLKGHSSVVTACAFIHK